MYFKIDEKGQQPGLFYFIVSTHLSPLFGQKKFDIFSKYCEEFIRQTWYDEEQPFLFLNLSMLLW